METTTVAGFRELVYGEKRCRDAAHHGWTLVCLQFAGSPVYCFSVVLSPFPLVPLSLEGRTASASSETVSSRSRRWPWLSFGQRYCLRAGPAGAYCFPGGIHRRPYLAHRGDP